MKENYPEPEKLIDINSPWKVTFDETMLGPSEPVTMNALTDWTESTDERIRYYSGTAIYSNSFFLEKIPGDATIYVDLGRVSIMADVRINGKPAGGVWTNPWRCNITGLVVEGQNSIEVEVVNNWVNRLIGDSMLQEKDRKTWINVNPVKPSDPLQQSGLLGPVSIINIIY